MLLAVDFGIVILGRSRYDLFMPSARHPVRTARWGAKASSQRWRRRRSAPDVTEGRRAGYMRQQQYEAIARGKECFISSWDK
jgi:hypothetical protein